MLLFANGSVHEHFGKILLLLANLTLGDKHDHSHVPHTNINAAIFLKIIKQIKFLNRGITVLKKIN